MSAQTDELIEKMLEFGISIEVAERLAPHFLRLENDPRGFRQALLEREPRLAERVGVTSLH